MSDFTSVWISLHFFALAEWIVAKGSENFLVGRILEWELLFLISVYFFNQTGTCVCNFGFYFIYCLCDFLELLGAKPWLQVKEIWLFKLVLVCWMWLVVLAENKYVLGWVLSWNAESFYASCAFESCVISLFLHCWNQFCLGLINVFY